MAWKAWLGYKRELREADLERARGAGLVRMRELEIERLEILAEIVARRRAGLVCREPGFRDRQTG